jgi:O-antigen/teichoic acid export membrane protein
VNITQVIKSIGSISAGTIGAQVIGLLALPVLTRLYSPLEFGYFATYQAIVLLFSIVCNFKLEKAIILPESDYESRLIYTSALYIVGLWGITTCGTIGLFSIFSDEQFEMYYFLIPAGIIATGINSIVIQTFHRHGKFSWIGILTFSTTCSIAIMSIAFKILLPENPYGLILGYFIGQISGIIIAGSINGISRIGRLLKPESISWSKLHEILRTYKDICTYHTLFALSSVGMIYLLPIIISWNFGEVSAGYYNIAYKIVMIPSVIVTTGVAYVFQKELDSRKKQQRHSSQVFNVAVYSLGMSGLVGFGLLYMFNDIVTTTLLGKEWQNAPLYITALLLFGYGEYVGGAFKNTVYIIYRKVQTAFNVQAIGIGASLAIIALLVFLKIKMFTFLLVISTMIFLLNIIHILKTKKVIADAYQNIKFNK